MKRLRYILTILFAGLVFALAFMSFTSESGQQQANQTKKTKVYDRAKLMKYTVDPEPEKNRLIAQERYKECPPLHPERFRRRVKMLWGIDVNDYPQDAFVWFGTQWENGEFKLSVKYQILDGVWHDDENAPIPYNLFDERAYIPFRQYLFFANTENASAFFKSYPLQLYDELKTNYEYYRMNSGEGKWETMIYYDLFRISYDCIYSISPAMVAYMDEQSRLLSADSYSPHVLVYNKSTPVRFSEIKADLVSLYVKEQLAKGRTLTSNMHPNPKENELWLGCVLDKDWGHNYNIRNIALPYNQDGEKMFPWRMDTRLKGSAGYLAYLLKINDKYTRKTVLLCMSGQLDDNPYFSDGEYEEIREQIRSNNYYGYAILREFCENPEREMPTLEKFGTSFNAAVVHSNTLLYLEPYPDSYDIDTMQPTEVFKAYEMGYDDYYFVEVVKPVESPVAGPDGYAMILDRTETIYGYIKKSAVKEVSEMEVASAKIKAQTGERKRGIIDDPDGYVNIRKASNAESEIIGKIIDKELFFYWEILNSSWWYVETKDNLNGFVHIF